jgi:uncharacterized membrane protein YgcG
MQKLNKTIASFKLMDPATNQPFPGPIPPTAMSMMCDWIVQSAFRNWGMSVATQYRVHAFQKQQKNMARKRMVGSAMHMITGGLGGGSGGFGSFGGGSTGFSF